VHCGMLHCGMQQHVCDPVDIPFTSWQDGATCVCVLLLTGFTPTKGRCFGSDLHGAIHQLQILHYLVPY
jgi:hypothetical protein